MRCDGVAVGEGVKPAGSCGHRPAQCGRFGSPDLNALAIDEVLAVIGLEQEPVPGGDFQFAGFAHIKGAVALVGKIHFRSIGTANTQAIFDDGGNLDRLALVKFPGLADEAQVAGRVRIGRHFFFWAQSTKTNRKP